MIIKFGEARNSPETKQDEKGMRSYVRRFVAVSNTLGDGPAKILSHFACPGVGDHYIFGGEFDLAARVRERTATRRVENSPVWDITINYSMSEEDEEDDNPLFEPVQADLSHEEYKEVAEGTANQSSLADKFTAEISNSAGEVYRNPTPEIENGYSVLTLVKNYAIDYDILGAADEYGYKLNNDQFFGQAVGKCKMLRPNATLCRKERPPEKGGPIDYLRVTWKFKIRDSWQLELLDCGSYYIPAAGDLAGENVGFRDKQGNAYVGLLDGTGDKLEDGANPQWRKFDVYKKKAFAALNLPNSFEECAKKLR